MDANAFLIIEDQPLTLKQCLQYLQTAGQLQGFVGDILRQYVIEREIGARPDLNIDTAMVEQAIVDFRLQQDLSEPQDFQIWLDDNGLDYSTFHYQVLFGFKLEALKQQIAAPQLQNYFIERKPFLDRVILSRIIVKNPEVAEQLKRQVKDGVLFEKLAQDYSVADDRIVNGMMGPVSRGTIPDSLRSAIDAAPLGTIVGPVEYEQQWGLFRVDQVLPAMMDDPQLQQVLQTELFERWLMDKVQNMTVQLQVE